MKDFLSADALARVASQVAAQVFGGATDSPERVAFEQLLQQAIDEVFVLFTDAELHRLRKFNEAFSNDPSKQLTQGALTPIVGAVEQWLAARWIMSRAPYTDAAAAYRQALEWLNATAPPPRADLVRLLAEHALQRSNSAQDNVLLASYHHAFPETDMASATQITFIFDTRGLPSTFAGNGSGSGGDPGAAIEKNVRAILKSSFGIGETDQRDKNTTAVIIGTILMQELFDPDAYGFRPAVVAAFQKANETMDALDSNGKLIDPQTDPIDAKINRDLYDAIVNSILAIPGRVQVDANTQQSQATIAYQEITAVANSILNNPNHFPLNDRNFDSQVRIGLDQYVEGAPPSDSLDLPPLIGTDSKDLELEGPNIAAVGIVYLSKQMEIMRLFDVVDRLSELNQQALIPLRYGTAAKMLDQYHWDAVNRLSLADRHMIYGRVVGMQGAHVSKEVQPNVQFDTLLLRFISNIAELDRQIRVTNLLEPGNTRSLALTQELVRKSGRDLAANASLYGWSGTLVQARRLKQDVLRALAILSEPELQRVYAANSPYQVIERVASDEFKQVPNIVKLRTMGEAGKNIFNIVANNVQAWGATSTRPLFTVTPPPAAGAANGQTGDISYDDYQSLLYQAQSWLAVMGVNDADVGKNSQPVDSGFAPSIPQVDGGVANHRGADGADIVGKLRQMVSTGTAPSIDQLQQLLPAFK
ncbi:hypothetical protein WM31_00840 [Burkholderia ubonensis]|nr:hypothetical protein WM31_00840 [Burkholderia ubonensis]